jgi:hypothetical protein
MKGWSAARYQEIATPIEVHGSVSPIRDVGITVVHPVKHFGTSGVWRNPHRVALYDLRIVLALAYHR